MVSQNTSASVAAAAPDIYIWMNSDEAAEALGTSGAIIRRRIDSGDLETRIADDGSRDVLVPLPALRPPPTTDRGDKDELRRARRSARLAWSVTAAMLLGGSAAAVVTARTIGEARERVRSLSAQIDRMSDSTNTLSTERDQLIGQLADARQTLARTEGELAVDRRIEDTLIKAVLAAHSAPPDGPGPTILANGAQ